ncbi:MAG: GNAT family N-acetyltransferase [Bacteroidia bacterium]
MSYAIRTLSLDDKNMAKAVVALTTTAFAASINVEQLLNLVQMPEAGVEPLYLGAFHQGSIVGFLACTPHRFSYDGALTLLYQPAWAATDPNWRGKGIFRSLISEASEILAAQGAGGMFASPNPRSGPVFTGPLGFEDGGYLPVGTVMGSKGLKAHKATERPQGSLQPYEADLLHWQQRRLGKGVIDIIEDEDGNRLWGRTKRMKKWGAIVPYWLVGGLEGDRSKLDSLLRQANHIPTLKLFFFTPKSEIGSRFQFVKKSNSNYLVWKSYNNGLPTMPQFDCMMGVFDHF